MVALNDDELMRLVKDELRRDPDVDAAAIAVAGSDGRVTLRGTVGSDREKRAVGKAGSIVGATPRRQRDRARSADVA